MSLSVARWLKRPRPWEAKRFLSAVAAKPQDAASASGPCAERATVAVAMSGGVDSSVAAFLLCQQGYRVIGVHMRNWDELDEQGPAACASDRDFADVQAVCRQLGVPAVRVDFVKEYWHDVFAPSLEAYSRGVTPNPDVLCNRYIKTGAFRQHARYVLGTDYVAFGHYARLVHSDGGSGGSRGGGSGKSGWKGKEEAEKHHPPLPRLLAGVDRVKDQSYFLSSVAGSELQDVLFPLGGLHKAEVRRLAAAAGLATATKRESMGLCFVGRRRRFGDFISEYLSPRPGLFVSADDGKPLGPHSGFELYTVGQKAKIGGAAQKWFVVGKDASNGSVTVAPGPDHPAVFAAALRVRKDTFNWIAGVPPPALAAGRPLRCRCKVRYRQEFETCVVRADRSSGGESMHWHVEFDLPARAVAPQQQLALYLGEECLGGGPIEAAVAAALPAQPTASEGP